EESRVRCLWFTHVCGVSDIGLMIDAQTKGTEGSGEAARALALGAEPQSRVRTVMGSLTGVSLGSKDCDSNPGASVTVTYEFGFVTPLGVLAGGGLGGDVDLSATGVMPCYG